MAIAFAVLIAVLRPSVSEMWQESGWFFGMATVVAYVVGVGGVLETFVRQTWLTESGIHYRSPFGRTTFVAYKRVRELVIEPDEALVIQYDSNRRLKVYAKEGDPEIIIEAMRRFLNPEIRVITV